jgi:hypothetical protein
MGTNAQEANGLLRILRGRGGKRGSRRNSREDLPESMSSSSFFLASKI